MMHIVIVDSILQSRDVALLGVHQRNAMCIKLTPLFLLVHVQSLLATEMKGLHSEVVMLCSSCFGITVYFFLHIENDFNCCFDLYLIVPMCR